MSETTNSSMHLLAPLGPSSPASVSREEKSPLAVEARGLGKRFGPLWALAHVDLQVAPGEALLLAGPNGSGKTTLLRLIAGLHRPSRGALEVLGRHPQEERGECRRLLSLVSHAPYLYDRLSALETARLWARLLEKPSDRLSLETLLSEVGLGEQGNVVVGKFSAGMRKRLALLRVRLEEPRVALLDEPFSALDAEGRALIGEWIHGFRSRGTAVVIASHALELAIRVCDRAVLLRQGQIAWHGPASELLGQYEVVA